MNWREWNVNTVAVWRSFVPNLIPFIIWATSARSKWLNRATFSFVLVPTVSLLNKWVLIIISRHLPWTRMAINKMWGMLNPHIIITIITTGVTANLQLMYLLIIRASLCDFNFYLFKVERQFFFTHFRENLKSMTFFLSKQGLREKVPFQFFILCWPY